MIYISLTTVPNRMEFERSAKINLLSLLNQNTDKDYKVLYNVPLLYKENNEEIIIPEWVLELQKENDKLVLNRGEDYGPVTKIVGGVLYTNEPDDVLIVCDDDHEYHEDMLEYHVKKLDEYPNCAIAFRGDRLHEKREWEEDGIKKHIFLHIGDNFPVKQDMNLAITGHWHSVSYKRSFFDDSFLDKDFLMNFHWSDDIIMAYYVAKKGYEIKCVAWDKETDFRLVNHFGRPCNSFPLKNTLPFESSGCHVLRNRTGEHVNDQATYPVEWVSFILDYYAKIHEKND